MIALQFTVDFMKKLLTSRNYVYVGKSISYLYSFYLTNTARVNVYSLRFA